MEQDLEDAGITKLPCAVGRCPSWSFLEGKSGNSFKMANVQYTFLQELHFRVCVQQQAESPQAKRRAWQKCSAVLFRIAH